MICIIDLNRDLNRFQSMI